MQYDTGLDPKSGEPQKVAPGVRCILAPNPSPMTLHGTNTYILGDTDLAVIDPGPDRPDHLEAILRAVGPRQQITHILVTHAHVDHSPLSRALAQATGAPVLAFGDAMAGRSQVMQDLAAHGLAGGGEGVDHAFVPDQCLPHGAVVSGPDWTLEALWTPGHFGNHLCFAFGDILFTGDLVMGWVSSLVSPPDGDLSDFMTSCAALRGRKDRLYLSGHGAPITDPAARLDWLIAHRQGREADILRALAQGPATAEILAQRIYTDTPPLLLPAAARNVFAHLIDLVGKTRVHPEGELSWHATFHLG